MELGGTLLLVATIGVMPSPTRAGNVRRVPPPATEFMTPLIVAATTTRMRRSVADNCTNDDEYQVGSAEARGFRTVSRDTMTIHDDRWMPLVRMRE